MPLNSHLRLYISFIIVVFVFVSTKTFGYDETFPLPADLEKNVIFWKSVFTDYLENEVIIHDARHVDIIYTIVNMDDIADEEATLREKWKAVGDIKSEYSAVLRKLANLPQPVSANSLGPLERKVFLQWQNVNDPDKFAKAAQNIRGQKGLRERFILSLERSGMYMDKICDILEKYNLPSEMCYLPHVESSFNYKAYSKVGAAGLWQFTRSTGRLFLDINYYVDERMDPLIATDAAARLLKKNYDELGSWPLAITAYNHGLGGMQRAKSKFGTEDFGRIVREYKSRTFGFASRNFYAEFLAAKEIAENYFQYFGYIDFLDPIEYKELILPRYVTVACLCQELDVPVEEIVALNPAWRNGVKQSKQRLPQGVLVKLPSTITNNPFSVFNENKPRTVYVLEASDKQYMVQPGDNLSRIAQRFGTDIDTLLTLNSLGNPNHIYIGQLLEMPIEENETNDNDDKPESSNIILNTNLQQENSSNQSIRTFVPTDNISPYSSQSLEESN